MPSAPGDSSLPVYDHTTFGVEKTSEAQTKPAGHRERGAPPSEVEASGTPTGRDQ